jgi:hypothetical protein
LWSFGKFCGKLVNFVVIGYIFPRFLTKKNLAALVQSTISDGNWGCRGTDNDFFLLFGAKGWNQCDRVGRNFAVWRKSF